MNSYEKISIGKDIPEADFHAIDMEMPQHELIYRIGPPHAIEKMHMDGAQLGISTGMEKSYSQATIDGYGLELWFYGKYVFYIVNGEVAGKALYTTEPIRLCIEEH